MTVAKIQHFQSGTFLKPCLNPMNPKPDDTNNAFYQISFE